jgi:hypothetical protein
MRTSRTAAALAALPLTVTALSGAAAPTMTYNGYFMGVAAVEDGSVCTSGTLSGVWDVRIPRNSDHADVHIALLKDGKIHAVWTMPFQVRTATADSFDLGLALGTDSLTMTLDQHGTFVYRLNAPGFCVSSMPGQRRN